jgi:hypothetical protein
MTIQECGMSDAVLETLARCFGRAAGDIKASSLSIITHLISMLFGHLDLPLPVHILAIDN